MTTERKCALAIHGGAGTIERSSLSAEGERGYRAGLKRSLHSGYEILKNGGSALDAVEAAVRALEDDTLFNAGRGAVCTSAGTHELDAAIMDGATLRAGSVTGLRRVRNPIILARLVMEKSAHVMLAGEGAETFARAMKVELVDQEYFGTKERRAALRRVQQAEEAEAAGEPFPLSDQDRHGTVGAVALDLSGNLAAATSTGGMTNKKFGRIGDCPIIGAGTYAHNPTCGVSATGDGEYFLRAVAGHDLSALMEYRGMPLVEAAQAVLEKVSRLGGAGGLIAMDKHGEITLPFNTAGMYRGLIDVTGNEVVEIYK